jgi:2-keto-4-pentenoate hydratase/2-oxohepta-3-ene-1,7-dioic acid hydratase in catechol pathway
MACWLRYRLRDGRSRLGTLSSDTISEFEGDMFAGARPTGATHGRAEAVLLSPCAPSKIVALWNNFHALAAKLDKQPPARALYFIKPSTCVIGSGEPIRRPGDYAGKIVFEGELGIVIGRQCRDVDESGARSCIFGYTCVNDVTAAQVLNENADFAQWCRSKSYDTFGCLGPVIATDLDWSRASVITELDGVERQNYALSDMVVAPERLVSQISHDMTLLPGDVIACGTSLGAGSMRDGSTVEIRIDGIGSLINVLAPR